MTSRIVSIQFASFVYAYGKSVISAWALELSVSTVSGNEKPQRVGQATGSSHALFYVLFLFCFRSSDGDLEFIA